MLHAEVLIPGFFITPGSKSPFRLMSDEELIRLALHDKSLVEILNYVQNGRKFIQRNCMLLREAYRFNGQVFKVKIVNSMGHHVRISTMFHGLRKILSAKTGIPEIDNLYPIGTSPSPLQSSTFFFVDKNLWNHLEMTPKAIQMQSIWKANQIPQDILREYLKSDSLAEKGVSAWDVSDRVLLPIKIGEECYYYIPIEERLKRLNSPQVVKRWVMPGVSMQKNFQLQGFVFDIPEAEGIAAFMPASSFKRMMDNAGHEPTATLVQVAAPIMKGLIRSIPNSQFIDYFGVPVQTDWTLNVIFVDKSLKDHSKVREAKRCVSQNCLNRGAIVETSQCIICGTETVDVLFLTLKSEEFGIFDSDRKEFYPNGKVSSQMIARGNVDTKRVSTILCNQLSLLQELSIHIWVDNTTITEEIPFSNDQMIYKEVSLTERLLNYINLSMLEDAESFQSAIGLLQAGIYPGHPKVLPRVREIIARMILESKQEIKLPAMSIPEVCIRYGYLYAVPNLEESDEIRIPETHRSIVSHGRLTIARNPIRVGGTDMATVSVSPIPAHGSCVEIPHCIWERMQGDYDGDIVALLPTWATGECQQRIIPPLAAKDKGTIVSFDALATSLFELSKSQMRIGQTDILSTKVSTEYRCQNRELSEEETQYLHDWLQEALSSMKKEVSVSRPPTRELAEIMKICQNEENPVNSVVFFNPANKIRVGYSDEGSMVIEGMPKLMKEFVVSTGHRVPNSPYKAFEWLQLLISYAQWLILVWMPANPTKSYQICNHPYVSVMEFIANLDMSMLKRNLFSISDMYEKQFHAVADDANEILSSLNIPDIQIAALLYFANDKAMSFTKLIATYRNSREGSDGADSLNDWSPVSEFINEFSINANSLISDICENCHLGEKVSQISHIKKQLERLLYGYLGSNMADSVLGQKVSHSLVFWVIPPSRLREVVKIYRGLHAKEACNLDPVTFRKVNRLVEETSLDEGY